MTIQRLGTTRCGPGGLLHVPLVRAGRWIFGTGLRATGPDGRLDPQVLRPGRPLGVPPQAQREAEHVFRRAAQLLQQAGSSLERVVRVDQYYTDPASVDPYHVARKQAMAGQVAPSTSVIVPALLNPDALLDLQFIASAADSGHALVRGGQGSLNVPSTSGYAPCLRAGDLIFVAGQLARDASGALAPEAQVPAGQAWNGTRIQLETDYLVRHRLWTALEAAGSAPDLVLKAQVYLSHAQDLAAFWPVWSRAFGGRVPPTTVVPVPHPAFGTQAATIEVNLVAAHAAARARVRDVECPVEMIYPDMLPARSLDGLLFVAGLLAHEDGGLCASARVDPAAPYYLDSARAQMEHVLHQAGQIFAAAGTDLSCVVRALHFHTNLHDFAPAHQAWPEALRALGLPFAAVQVAHDLFVPGARILLDLWGSLPEA